MKEETRGIKRHYICKCNLVIFSQFLGFGWIQGQQLDADTLPRPFANYFFYD